MTTTWNPSDAGPRFSFLNANATAVFADALNGVCNVRGTTSKSTGSYYFEIECTTLSPDGGIGGGVANASASLSLFLGDSSNSAGVFKLPNSTDSESTAFLRPFMFFNSFTTYTYNPNDIVSGAVLGIAVDVDRRYVWIRSSVSMMWNMLSTTIDGQPLPPIWVQDTPALVTGGGSHHMQPSGPFGPETHTGIGNPAFLGPGGGQLCLANPAPIFPIGIGFALGDVITLNCGPSFAMAVPAGYSAWD